MPILLAVALLLSAPASAETKCFGDVGVGDFKVIDNVCPGGPYDAIGFRNGDVLLSMDGQPIDRDLVLKKLLALSERQCKFREVKVKRGEKEITIKCEGTPPMDRKFFETAARHGATNLEGKCWGPLMVSNFDVICIQKGSIFEKLGLQLGDRLISMDGKMLDFATRDKILGISGCTGVFKELGIRRGPDEMVLKCVDAAQAPAKR
jgi:hypothetical protein